MANGISIESLGIVTKQSDPTTQKFIRSLIPVFQYFKKKNPHAVIFLEKDARFPDAKLFKRASLSEMSAKADLILSIGGDGTILRSTRFLLEDEGWQRALILGINAGHLGFLTFLSSSESSTALRKIFTQPEEVSVEKRTCLRVSIIRNRKTFKEFHTLNDCVLNKGSLARILRFQLEIDGQFLSSYRADGLIVSTPTGSTAYNLAAGGAILAPQIPALQITPICPQSLSNKPIVLSDAHKILLRLSEASKEVYLTLDGQTGIRLQPDDEVRIERSPKTIRFLLPPGMGFSHYFLSLRQKLKWGLNIENS